MLRRVALVRTDISEELSASFIRVTRIGELGTTLAVTSKRRTLQEPHGVTSQKTLFFMTGQLIMSRIVIVIFLIMNELPHVALCGVYVYPERITSRNQEPV
jgi:hypothetical protein